MPDAGVVAVKLMLPIAYFIPPRDLVSLAVLAEEVGLDGVTCGELNGVEEFSMLAATAAATERIHLETAITAVPTRPRSEVLASARALSDLAPGRFTLGLGAGTPLVAAFHGQPFEAPLRRTEEELLALRSHLAPEGIRVTLAAVNPKMVALAAHAADGVVLSLLTPPSLVASSATQARRAYAEAGRTDPFEVTAIQYGFWGGDSELAEAAFRRELAAKFDVSTYRAAAVASASEAEADAVRDAWRAKDRDLAVRLIPQRTVDSLLTVGDGSAFAARNQELVAAGADAVIVVPVTPRRGRVAEARDLVRALGEARGIRPS